MSDEVELREFEDPTRPAAAYRPTEEADVRQLRLTGQKQSWRTALHNGPSMAELQSLHFVGIGL